MLLVACATIAGLGVGWLCWQWARNLLGGPEGLPPRPAACLSCALAWACACWLLGLGARTLELLALSAVLVTLSLTDLAARVIPDACVMAALVPHLCYEGVLVARGSVGITAAVGQTLLGGAAALVPLLALTLAMDRVLQAESMGGGDLKLLAVGGAYVGWRLFPLLLFVACCLGLCIAVLPLGGRTGRGDPFPFGPAIAAALWLTLLVAPSVDAWLATWVF